MKQTGIWKPRGLQRCVGRTGLGLMILAGLAGGICRVSAQGTFGNPIVISGGWGNITQDNTGFTSSPGEPSIAGVTPNAPVWFQWTATQDGEVEFDTIGSVAQEVYYTFDNNDNLILVTNSYQLDTVLGVYTGTNLTSLNQISVNDDLYPVSGNTAISSSSGGLSTFAQENETGDSSLASQSGPGGSPLFAYYQPYYGPSGLRFNAKSGVTYYIAVDTKPTGNFSYFPTGLITLNWAYKSSGVFRWATEDEDSSTGLPVYKTSQTETSGLDGNDNSVDSVYLTYYNYNVPGVLVTVTRTAGSTGRATVYYTTVDGGNLVGSQSLYGGGNDVAAYTFYTNIVVTVDTNGNVLNTTSQVLTGDYSPVGGTLVFDDFEMSKTILIPINSSGGYLSNPFYTTNEMILVNSRFGVNTQYVTLRSHNNNNLFNADFGVVLSHPQTDPLESSDVSQPRVDPQFSTALVKILNTAADPYGPDYVSLINTNTSILFSNTVTMDTTTNAAVAAGWVPNEVSFTNYAYFTNFVLADSPTNVVINFEKANYRVPADVNQSWPKVTLWVERFGTNGSAQTVNYQINNYLGIDNGADEEDNALFPLQPGSDYAVPTPPSQNVWNGRNSDFNMVAGSVNFPNSGPGSTLQPITFTVSNSVLTKFNKDFKIQLHAERSIGGHDKPVLLGMNNETTVTILFNDQNPPAGSVDELYNADFNSDLALPPAQVPQTWPVNNLDNPGVSGLVYGLAVLPNNETIIAGNFSSYNGVGQNNIALLETNGAMDTSFYPGTGPSGAVNAVALDGGQFVIGGAFNSYNGTGAGNFARLNADGSLDTAFSTTKGSGANAAVRAVAVQADGKVIIGGDFTKIDGVTRNYLARLNADGSLDTSFDPGNTLNGSVYALALPSPNILSFANAGSGETAPQTISLGTATAGTMVANYSGTNMDMMVFYGDTNIAAGTGVLIYDTGNVTGNGTFTLPIGPTGGITTNIVTIVMDQGYGSSGNPWSYNGTITIPSSLNGMIAAGGQFNVAGQGYANIVRFTTSGVLDTSFNPGTGMDSKVLALAWQPNNQIIAGGVFTHVNGSAYNRLVRFNADGSIDTTNFFVGTGANDVVYNITLQSQSNSIYVGGQFSSFNGTHRLGFTRLYSNGTVDTTFMDMAYNQFAGLKRIYSYDLPGVYASGIQSDGNVMIGGSFDQVGGGQADPNVCNVLDDELYYTESFGDPNLWVEPKTRDGVRNRSSIARLIGGVTPGPGNIGLQQTSFSANNNQSSLSVGLVRTNGNLGPVSAAFSVVPGLAQNGSDYAYYGTPPLYWIDWEYLTHPSRMHEDGLSGVDGFLVDPYGLSLTRSDLAINSLSTITVSILKDVQNPGNLNAQFQLANPVQADQFYLGGENIPLGAALGASSAPLTIVDTTQTPGVFGFSSSNFVATSASAPISVLRSNGIVGNITVRYSTINSNSTAVVGTDYTGLTNAGPLVFGPGVVSNGFAVQLRQNGYIYTNMTEKTVYLALSQLGNSPPGATYGISNAILRLINPNYKGYLTLAATNFSGAESSGSITFVVNRVAGSLGSVSVQYATTNGSAWNGRDYIGATNTLNWNSGDVSQKIITVPLVNTGVVGTTNRQFGVSLFNPMVGSTNTPSLMGAISNATLTITDDNSYGSLQFSTPVYNVNENGGSATITVIRTGAAVGQVSVNYATSPGVNTVAGVNYSNTVGTLVFAAGQTSASFAVPVMDDGIVDGAPASFYFNVALSNPTNAALGSTTAAIVQILDAESYNRPPGSPDAGFIAAGMNGNVFTLALQPGGQILAGGNFTAVGSTSEGSFARLNPDGTLDTTFLSGLAGANGSVQSIVCQTDGRILVGGSFGSVDGYYRNFIARVMTDGSLDTSFNPGSGADNVVDAVAETFIAGARKIYVGGAFGNVSGSPSPGVGRLNNDGSADASFSIGSGADGAVFAVAAYPTNSLYAGKVLIGGNFAHFNGTSMGGLARLNVDGSLDTNYNAGFGLGAAGAVRALAIQPDGRVVVGGSFTNFNGAPIKYVVRLNTDGTVDTSFAASTSDSVEGIALQPDNRIVLVGQFTLADGVTRSHITRLLPTGATDPTINFGDGANGDVDTVVVQPSDGMLVIGGNFSQYDDQSYASIARIYGGSVTGSGQFEFTTANYQVDETGNYAQITIRRIGGTSGTNADNSGDIFVNFATTNNGTAVANVNYSNVNVQVDFPAGEVLRTVTVPVMDDYVITPNLTVGLVLSSPTPAGGLGNQPTATLTILNDDSAVSFSSTFYTVLKNTPDGMATIDISRQGGTSNTCTVGFYTTTNGTAIPTTDYTPVSGTVTFNPGDSDQTFQIPINNNGLAEGNQTVGLALTNAANTLLYAPSNATLTIIDTTPAPGRLSFSATNYTVMSTGTNAVVTVVRTNGSVGSVSVSYATTNGTALSGVNYNSVSGWLTFLNDETVKTILVPLVANNLVQGPVTFSVLLSNPTGGAVLIDPTNTAVTIINNNFGVAFVNATNYLSETNSTGLIYVQRVGNPAAAFAASYTTVDGTARAGINYTAVAGTLSFASGEVLKTITVPLFNNFLTTNLTFGMTLSSPTAGVQLVAPSNAVVILQAGMAGLSFTNPAMSVLKDVGTAIVPVVCSNPGIEPVIVDSNTVPLSVQYYTVDGTAVNGQDYTAVSGTLVFTNGAGTNNISVPVSNNSLITGNRTFTVVLTNATAPGKITSPSNQVVTIIDSNSGLSFSSPVYSVLRNGVFQTITIIRTDNTNTESRVNFTTIDGTGVAYTDYLPTNGTCIFTNGVTSQTFTVTVLAGTTVQPDKTVLLQLSNPRPTGSFLSPPSAAVLTIHDNSGSLVVPAGSTLIGESFKPANGIIDPGETVTNLFAFRAAGGNSVTNLYATLLATNGVTSPSPTTAVSYGRLNVGGPSASRAFSFTASGTNGQQISPTFLLNNGVTNIGTAQFTYTLGTWTTTFYNTNAIIINAGTQIAAVPGSPYPSTIIVSNLGGILIKATVTLTNMSHSAPSAINTLLVSPSQNDTLFMSHVGGGEYGGAISGVTLTFDDAATNSLPFNGQITNGVYKPTRFGGAPMFP